MASKVKTKPDIGTISKIISFAKELYTYKKLTPKLARKRRRWSWFIAVLSILLSYSLIFISFPSHFGLFVFSLCVFNFVFGILPLHRVICPKCGNRKWFRLYGWPGASWTPFYRTFGGGICPKCGEEIL
jgi:Na+/melibiose symporter-like transporter